MIESPMILAARDSNAIGSFVASTIASGVSDSTFGGFMHTPTEALRGVGAAMTMLRLGVEEPVATAALDESLATTTDERLFADLTRSMLNPHSWFSDHLMFATPIEHKNPGVCKEAELAFAALLRAKQTGATDPKVGPALVFEDLEAQPVFLQKFYGADSALSLAPVTIEGIDYPAGTLYSLHSQAGKKLHHRFDLKMPRTNLRIKRLSTAEVNSIAPLRLSTITLPVSERPGFPLTETERAAATAEDLALVELVNTATIQDFADAFSR